jgi:hypothetical protein
MVKKGHRKQISGKVLFLLGLLIAAFAVAGFLQFRDLIADLWPDQAMIASSLTKLEKDQQKLQDLLNENQKCKMDHKAFLEYASRFWIDKRDGNVETMAQRRVEDAARKAGLTLSSIGRVQPQKIADGIFSVEISITLQADTAEMARFVQEIYRSNPRFYWHRITLRPDNLRNPKNVILSGNLRFVAIANPDLAALIVP